MNESSPETKLPSPEQLARAFEEGVRLGAKLKESSHGSAVGISPEETGAFHLGLEKGHDIFNENPDISARNWAAGYAVGTYKLGREKGN